jgi:hypothetical protein
MAEQLTIRIFTKGAVNTVGVRLKSFLVGPPIAVKIASRIIRKYRKDGNSVALPYSDAVIWDYPGVGSVQVSPLRDNEDKLVTTSPGTFTIVLVRDDSTPVDDNY